MFNRLFSSDTRGTAFFRRVDWFAFWTATSISFVVYFLTLGPSVGLEDSGELIVAGDHLGVPHPPGYPIWTMCAYIFCRLFDWVTYQGQPTPAWSISLLSAVFAAFAAGITAMLITRSASDMMRDTDGEPATTHNAFAWAGGVGGSLVFAFSPVMWSQATIVEVYTLNAFFLMWIFLLTYRWMRKPSDKILWLTAFVFGLGLTNYQVLLLAALPLAIVILLRDIPLFRDFFLILIPMVLTAQLLQIGSLLRADRMMQSNVIAKNVPMINANLPNATCLILGIVALLAGLLTAVILHMRNNPRVRLAAFVSAVVGTLMILVSGLSTHAVSFAEDSSWAPLLDPSKYLWIAALLTAVCISSAAGAMSATTWREKTARPWLIAASVIAVIAIFVVAELPAASLSGYTGEPFAWGVPTLALLGGLAIVIATCAFLPRGLFFALPVATVQLVTFILLRKGAMNGLTHPSTWWFWWPIIWNFILLGLACLTLPRGRTVAISTFLAELGVSFYVYMPIVSDLRNPPMNWGFPRTWEGFKHAVTRGQYEKISPVGLSDVLSLKFLKQITSYFTDLRMQFTLIAATLGLLPFTMWRFVSKKFTFRAVYAAAALYILTVVLVLESEVRHGEPFFRLDKLLIAMMGLLVVIGVIIIIVHQIEIYFKKKLLDCETGSSFELDNTSQQWLIATGVGFAMMSIFLVALADIKGDLQDGFIQKVKFISSHGLFAIWIGYGLVFGLTVIDRITRALQSKTGPTLRHIILAFAVIAATLTAAIPVYENYTNDALVSAMSGAEQNGHDFGWQFGNYQLRGADAITEELEADEEPLPNPLYPEAMEPHAIFFGGTDPGRFVPTYMIYSAKVRPDVFLITQNALADNTYMATMRAIMGNDVWIPSIEDSARAFEVYVDEVQSGKRQANAELLLENGRVQVTGALGVMEINSVLTEMMFKKEKSRRAFYIEESYVIQWMYPYLSPHGLIMKINTNPTSLTPERMRDDMEFWDWYTRHLTRSPMFRRDFPAQKSFSKLRSAIAGLYTKRGSLSNAEQAFREACILYPASPEANFRMIQECCMPQRQWDVALDMIAEYNRLDPNNERSKPLANYILQLQKTMGTIDLLGAKARAGSLTHEEAFILAEAYASLGQNTAVSYYIAPVLKTPNLPFATLYRIGTLLGSVKQWNEANEAMTRALPLLPNNASPDMLRTMADVFAQARNIHAMQKVLNLYIRQQPNDWKSWLDLSLAYAAESQTQSAQYAIQRAIETGGPEAMKVIQSDSALMQLARPVLQRMMQQQQPRGIGPTGFRR